MRALLLAGLAALSTPAFAEPFNNGMLPHTTTFDYNWSSVGVMGSTTFTFTGTPLVGNSLCNQVTTGLGSSYCHDGTFTTGNNGNGTFTTRIDQSCSTNSFWAFGWFQIRTCDVDQLLTATYQYASVVVNPAVYTGTAPIAVSYQGRQCAGAFWTNCPAYGNRLWDTSVAADYDGNLSGPATGTFFEN